MEFDPKVISIIGFIREHGIVNEKGEPLDFSTRRYLYAPMCDWSQFQVYKKAAQVGMSVTMAIKSLYGCKQKQWNIIHTFPSDSNAAEFVNTKTNKILRANKVFENIPHDNVERKEIDGRFLYYKGCNSPTAAVMTTADLIIHDEKDRGDAETQRTFNSRVLSSKFKGIWELSNPSVEGAGVDVSWNESDKKEWMCTCDNGHELPLVWPESIDISNKKFVCQQCKVELTNEQRRMGRWVQTGKPDAKFSGYHMTLLMVLEITAEYVIEQYNDGKDPEYFYNFILGEPYSPGDTKLERHAILDNWTPKNIETGNLYLGVDIGNIKHFVLGSEKGIIRVGTFTEWHELDKLLMTPGLKVTVIDAMPENTMAHHYKDTYQNVFLCHFGVDKENNTVIRWGEGDKFGLVFVDRNRAIDRLVGTILGGEILYSLPSDRDFRTYVKHCSDLRRVKEVNNRGIEHFVWDSLTGEDHFFFATLYYDIARQAGGTGVVFGTTPEKVQAVIRTNEGFRNNLKEVLEKRVWTGYSGD